jgi:hypothetical protein
MAQHNTASWLRYGYLNGIYAKEAPAYYECGPVAHAW